MDKRQEGSEGKRRIFSLKSVPEDCERGWRRREGIEYLPFASFSRSPRVIIISLQGKESEEEEEREKVTGNSVRKRERETRTAAVM